MEIYFLYIHFKMEFQLAFYQIIINNLFIVYFFKKLFLKFYLIFMILN